MHFIFVSDKFGTVVNFNLILHSSYYFSFFFSSFCYCFVHAIISYLVFFYLFFSDFFFILFLFCKLVTYREEIFLSQYIFNYFSSYFFFAVHSFWVVDYFCWLCFDLIFAQLLFDIFFSCVFTFLLFLVFYIITCVYERYTLFTFK